MLVEAAQVVQTLDGLPVEAATGQGGEGGPFRGQTGRQVGGQFTTIGEVQGTPALHQEQGGLVLGLRAEIRHAQGPGDHVPGEGHELVSTRRRTGIAGGAHHPVRMAIERIEQAAPEKDAITDLVAVGPGALGVADGVEQGPALGRDGEDAGGGRQRRQHRHLGGGYPDLGTQLPGTGRFNGPGRTCQAQAEAGDGKDKVTALQVGQEKGS